MCTQDELKEVIEKYGNMVYRLVFSFTGLKEVSEDITQDVYVKYMLHNHSFASEEHKKAWLIKVAMNESRKYFRSSERRKRADVPLELIEAPISSMNHVEEKYILLNAIRKLSMDYQSVIYFYYYEELSVAEIAKLFQKKESTICSHLSRARKKLKKYLEDAYEF